MSLLGLSGALGDLGLALGEVRPETVDGLVEPGLAGHGPVVGLLLRAEAGQHLVVGLAELALAPRVRLGLALAGPLLLQLVLEPSHLALELLETEVRGAQLRLQRVLLQVLLLQPSVLVGGRAQEVLVQPRVLALEVGDSLRELLAEPLEVEGFGLLGPVVLAGLAVLGS